MRLAKALNSLCVCAFWSEPLLVAHTTLLEILYYGSIVFMKHCAPNHFLVHKDDVLFQDKGHLMVAASSYNTGTHPS